MWKGHVSEASDVHLLRDSVNGRAVQGIGFVAVPRLCYYRQVELRDGLPFDVVVPTATTQRTFKASEAGRDLIVCEDADDMFRKLGI
jgi:hypothetical protein